MIEQILQILPYLGFAVENLLYLAGLLAVCDMLHDPFKSGR